MEESTPSPIANNWFYQDQSTQIEYKNFAPKKAYVNPAKIHEISCYYLVGLQGSGKSAFVKNFIENNYKNGETRLFYISSLDDVPKYIEQMQENDKSGVKLFNDSHFQNHTLHNPFEDILSEIKASETARSAENQAQPAKISGKLDINQIMLKTYGEKYKLPKSEPKETKKMTCIPYIMIVDDMIFKNAFKNDSIYIQMLKCYRHWNLAILISTQSLVIENELGVRKLFQTYVVYNSLNNKEIANIYEESSLPCDFKTFLHLYETMLVGKHDFFIIDKCVVPQLFVVEHEYVGDQLKKKTFKVF